MNLDKTGLVMKIIVDADACPKTALQICMDMGQEYSVQVWTVASFNHRIESDNHIVVGNSSQEADIKLMNLTQKRDVVVTQDWGLAAMVLGKGALCLSPVGRIFNPDTVEFLLEERETKAKLRRSGGRTKGPKKRSNEDDEHFRDSLEGLLKNAKHL
jgi:uncharacterized protein